MGRGRIKIALADSNRDYAERLFSAMSAVENYSVSVFTDKKVLEDTLASSKYDILMISPDMFISGNSSKNAKLLVLLYDEDERIDDMILSKCKCIKKYQRASSICREMIGHYSEVAPRRNMQSNGNECYIISVYSPAGGSGKTSVSLAVCSSLASKGKRVLYLNMECYASYGSYMELKGGKGMDEVISAASLSANYDMKLESLVRKTLQGVSYVEKFDSLFDIYEVTRDDIEKVTGEIAKTNMFDYIVIDMSSDFNETNRGIFDISDRIILVETKSRTAKEKLAMFASCKTVEKEYAEKIMSVINYAEGNDQSECGYTVIGRVPQKRVSEDIVSVISRNSLIDIDLAVSR